MKEIMISAIARSAVVLDNNKYEDAAITAINFVNHNLLDNNDKLLKRIRIESGKAGLDATIEDYSFLIWGIIELYHLTYDPSYLELASFHSDFMIEHFFWYNTT